MFNHHLNRIYVDKMWHSINPFRIANENGLSSTKITDYKLIQRITLYSTNETNTCQRILA